MIRNDGEILECGEFHPYIFYDIRNTFEENLQELIVDYPNNLIWFFDNTNDDAIRKLIVKSITYLSSIFVNKCKFNFVLDVANIEFSDLEYLMHVFSIEPIKFDHVLELSYLHGVELMFEELNRMTNQEFLRCRTNDMYAIGNESAIYFRVSSIGFNWFNIIWKIAQDNGKEFNSIYVMYDMQSLNKNDFIKLRGKEVKNMPISDFITLSGSPIIEHYSNYIMENLRQGKSYDEAFSNVGFGHRRGIYNMLKSRYVDEGRRQ